jgi:hypothetical protein
MFNQLNLHIQLIELLDGITLLKLKTAAVVACVCVYKAWFAVA